MKSHNKKGIGIEGEGYYLQHIIAETFSHYPDKCIHQKTCQMSKMQNERANAEIGSSFKYVILGFSFLLVIQEFIYIFSLKYLKLGGNVFSISQTIVQFVIFDVPWWML